VTPRSLQCVQLVDAGVVTVGVPNDPTFIPKTLLDIRVTTSASVCRIPRCSRGRPGGVWCPPSCARGLAVIVDTPIHAVMQGCETPSRATSASRGR